MTKIKLLTSFLVLPMCATSLASLTNCNKSVEQTDDFASDSWETIISYANQGIKALVDHYKPNGGTFVITPAETTPEQIAAKTRTVHIEGYGDFKVRVVGECIDKIDDNTNAALTFEFSEIITNDCFHDDLTVANPSYYATSHIKQKLSEILDFFPEILKNNIQTVKQTTAVIPPESNYDSEVSDEKLFIMSLDEVYGVCSEQEEAVLYENHCYQYYQYSTHQSTKAHIKQYFNKEIGAYENCAYWLKTPLITELETSNKKCHAIYSDGYYTPVTVNSSLGISPCFCLGKEAKGIINIGTSVPGFDILSSQIVDTNQDIIVKIKPKQYKGKDVLKVPEGTDEGKAQIKIHNENGRVYSNNFQYDPETGEIKLVQNRIDKSMVLEIWKSQIALDYTDLVDLCHDDERNSKNGSLILDYFNVGSWISIKLDDTTYKVNVIGIGHDTIDGNKKAAITLEFYSPFIGYKWDNNGNNDYLSSSLNVNLNGIQSTSILNKLKTQCPELTNNIKDVHKNVFVKKDDKWVVQDYATKLFVLSEDEFLGQSLSRTGLGQQYDYYDINSDDPDGLTRGGCEFWTRSTDIISESKNAWVFRREQGRLKTDSYETNSDLVYVTPAFCI